VAEEIMKEQVYKTFTTEEVDTWKILYSNLDYERRNMIHPYFKSGLDELGIDETHTPDLADVNSRLSKTTGWQGVAVEGLEGGDSFYPGLKDKKFPIGNFLRSKDDLSYTPAPDVFHDFYGHIPFFTQPKYAKFCEEYGKLASLYLDDPKRLRMYERLFWFTIEFGLIKTNEGTKIFGAGIVSSKSECKYALSNKPEVLPFDPENVAYQEFDIDHIQKRIFLLDTEEQLYSCLPKFDEVVRNMDTSKEIPPVD
jgi:phenylalanine-4-hydroxylase